jgi:hypothetical protein
MTTLVANRPLCSVSYQYYSLPYCKPPELEQKREDLGEVLEGDRMTSTLYDVPFRVSGQMQQHAPSSNRVYSRFLWQKKPSLLLF